MAAWLYRVACNKAVDALRRLGRRPVVSLDQMIGVEDSANHAEPTRGDPESPFRGLQMYQPDRVTPLGAVPTALGATTERMADLGELWRGR